MAKTKKFSEFFVTFLKSILNYKHFQKKDDPLADVSLEIPAPKNMLR